MATSTCTQRRITEWGFEVAQPKYTEPTKMIVAHITCGAPLRLVKEVWPHRVSTFWECPIHGECPSDEREFLEAAIQNDVLEGPN